MVKYIMCVPSSLRLTVLQHYHSHPLSGHRGIYKTYKRLQEVALWPGICTDVKHHIRSCVKCQTLRYDNQKSEGNLQSVTTTSPNEMLGVDIVGPLLAKWVTAVFHLLLLQMGWGFFFPVCSATAQNVTTILRKVILTQWGAPNIILSW